MACLEESGELHGHHGMLERWGRDIHPCVLCLKTKHGHLILADVSVMFVLKIVDLIERSSVVVFGISCLAE